MKCIGNLLILGDSYSTFEGHIPENCFCWYFKSIQNDTDVSKLEETWWDLLLKNTHSKLLLNCSSSGTTICHTGYNASDCSDNISFAARLKTLVENNFFEKNHPDTVIVFGGTNDTWANSPLGEIKFSTKTKDELFFVFPAYCYIIETFKKYCKNARIITVVNTDLKQEIVSCFDEVSKHYETEIFKLEKISKQSGHPNKEGMKQIFSQILEKL